MWRMGSNGLEGMDEAQAVLLTEDRPGAAVIVPAPVVFRRRDHEQIGDQVRRSGPEIQWGRGVFSDLAIIPLEGRSVRPDI